MFDRKLILAMCVAVVALMPCAFAQVSSPSAAGQPQPATATAGTDQIPEGGVPTWIHPETPQHRRDRLAGEDPGPNPDLNKHFWRFGKSYHIERYERRLAAYDREEGTVRPLAMVNFAFEIYQQNEKYVWVWIADPEEPAQAGTTGTSSTPVAKSRYNDLEVKFFEKSRPQFSALEPPMSDKTILFEEASDGLPKQGSWRNSLAVGDMNEDGCPDLIAPPQRGTANYPAIFLGDCKGHWKIWDKTNFPHAFDYGSAVVADFNKDGHLDVAFAVHLTGVFVYLGDGKGNFRESSEGLPKDFGTRRIAVTDANNDGYPDIVAISEGPSVQGMENPRYGKVRLYLNKKKGTEWQGIDVVQPGVKTGADWISVGNFNGDPYPDFVFGSIFQGSWDIVYLSKGPNEWKVVENDGDLIPSLAYYFASTTGKFSSKTHDDAILSYVRYWPTDLEAAVVPKPSIMELTGVDRLSFTKDGVKRTPIAHWSGHEGVAGLASGDFDGDGNLDIIYTRYNPREAVIELGDGKGGFTRAKTEGLTIAPNRNYDLTVADVNGDGRPDVIVMYETSGTSSLSVNDGSIHVFLNRGPIPKTKASSPEKK